MTSNTFTVITTTEAARIGDVVVATNHNDTAVVERGRLVDVRIDELILEKDNGYRVALSVKDWSFTAAPSTPPRVEAVEAWQRARASKSNKVAAAATAEQIARVIYLHGLYVSSPSVTPAAVCVAPGCKWASDLTGVDLRDAHNTHVAEVIRALPAGQIEEFEPGHTVVIGDTRYYHVGKLQDDLEKANAEVARLTALVEHKQTVINEDRADTKRNHEIWADEVADLKHAVALEVDRTNDANQRADELVARIQELEVEAARHEHALEKADDLIQALRRRYGTHVVLQRAQADDDRAARLIREADEQNNAARALTKQKPRTGGDPRVWAPAPDAKFAKFPLVDLGEYMQILENAAREMATAQLAGVEPVLNQILVELRRLRKRADTRARVARKASTR